MKRAGYELKFVLRKYTREVKLIVTKVCELLKINTSNLYLFGSSGGGYVALQLSMYLKNANYIAINPQLKLSRFFYANEFIKQTGIDFNEPDFHRRNDTIDVVKEVESFTTQEVTWNITLSIPQDGLTSAVVTD